MIKRFLSVFEPFILMLLGTVVIASLLPARGAWATAFGHAADIGIVLLFVDRMKIPVRYEAADRIPPLTALGIGFFQCLAMVPGVSRSGATIVGAMLL